MAGLEDPTSRKQSGVKVQVGAAPSVEELLEESCSGTFVITLLDAVLTSLEHFAAIVPDDYRTVQLLGQLDECAGNLRVWKMGYCTDDIFLNRELSQRPELRTNLVLVLCIILDRLLKCMFPDAP